MSSSQKTGDNSIAVVSQGSVSIHTGVGVADVKEIVRDMLKETLTGLQSTAYETAHARSEKLLQEFLDAAEARFGEKIEERLASFADPGTQYAYREAQTQYCRYGAEDNKDISIELLVERLNTSSSDIEKIITDEALQRVGKLTAKQIKLLTAYLAIDNIVDPSIVSKPSFVTFLNRLSKYGEGLEANGVEMSVLTSLGLISQHEGLKKYLPAEEILRKHYPGVFYKGHGAAADFLVPPQVASNVLTKCLNDPEKFQPNHMKLEGWKSTLLENSLAEVEADASVKVATENLMSNDEARVHLISLCPDLEKFIASWNNDALPFSHHRLTTLGQVIAIATIRRDGWMHISIGELLAA